MASRRLKSRKMRLRKKNQRKTRKSRKTRRSKKGGFTLSNALNLNGINGTISLTA